MTENDFATAAAIKVQIGALEEEKALWGGDAQRSTRLTIAIGGRTLIYTPASVIADLRVAASAALEARIAELQADFNAL